jgi:hypothetical protein
MLTIPNSMLLVASSPYAQRGALWEAYRRHYAKPGKILVWQAPSVLMNPTIPQSEIDAALEEDPEKNKAEYLAQFRSDLETFVPLEVINACTVAGRFELAPGQVRNAFGFVDMSGGKADSHCCAIAFKNANNVAVLAALMEKQRGDTENVVREFAALLRNYGTSVHGDLYGRNWVTDAFRRHDIKLIDSPMNRSELYLEMLPMLRSRQIELLDIPKLRNQLQALERHTARTGKDTVAHPPGSHDDLINAAAGALVMCATADRKVVTWNAASDDPGAWQRYVDEAKAADAAYRSSIAPGDEDLSY